MKKIVSLAISFALIMMVSLPNFSQAQSVSVPTKYSGEELFKGIFFAQGEVAKELDPVFSDKLLEAGNQPEVVKIANDMVEKIKQADNSYFDSLQKAVDSKDPLLIQSKLDIGADLIIKHSEELMDQAKIDMSIADGAVGNCVVLALGVAVIYYGAVVAQLAAGVVYVAGAAVYLKTAAVSNSIDDPPTELSDELLIKTIIVNL